MERFKSYKLTFENLAAMAATQTSTTAPLTTNTEMQESDYPVPKAFNDVWRTLRQEYTEDQISGGDSLSFLPQIKSNIRKSLNNSTLSQGMKTFLIRDIDKSKTAGEILRKIAAYLHARY
jgi:hypothetical protein